MDDIQEVLWQQFEIEVSEHLDILERELGSPDNASAPDAIATIFRSFHSTKGLGAAMGVTSVEALSHSAESLFAQVRDGHRALDAGLAETLLQVVDALRAMVPEAVAQRGDATERNDLLELLATKGPISSSATANRDTAGSGDALDAADEGIARIADRLAAVMSDLVAALMPDCESDALRRLDDDLLELDEAIGPLGLQGLRRQLRQLSRAVRKEGPDDPLIRGLAVALGTVEELTGRSAGRRELLSHVAQRSAGKLLRACATAAEWLMEEADADQAIVALRDAADHAGLLELPHSVTVLTLASDVLQRGTPTEITRQRIGRIADRIGETAASNPPSDLAAEDAVRFREMLRAGGLADSAADLVERARQLGVSDLVLDQPSDETIEKLRSVLDDPNLILLELEANLESDSGLAARVATWIGDNADPLASRVVASGDVPRTRLLVATAARPAAIKADLNTLDPGRGQLNVRICDGHEAEEAEQQAAQKVEEIVRVPARAIDDLLDRLSELMPVAAGLEELAGEDRLEAILRSGGAHQGLSTELLAEAGTGMADHRDRLRTVADDLGRVLRGLRDATMDLRVVPIETLFNRFPRVARDLARSQAKEIRVTVEGNDARIDKGMVEQLTDPLMHMVRNAVDHGMEPPDEREAAGKPRHGQIELRAEQRGEHVVVELRDDGRGIDATRIRAKAVERGMLRQGEADALGEDAAMRLIFEPGFSTTQDVTQTSGRGVGMDVVSSAVSHLGGSISVSSIPGEGTTLSLDLPLSVALQRTLLVELGPQLFAIPDRRVVGIEIGRAHV